MIPADITFRHVDSSDFREDMIHEQLEKLEHVYDRIVRCHVVIDPPSKHHRHGATYLVKVQLSVPRSQIIVDHVRNEDLSIAIRDAFKAARRQLVDYVQSQHAHPHPVEVADAP